MKIYLLLIITSLGLASCTTYSYWDYMTPSPSFDSCPYDEGQARICLFPALFSSASIVKSDGKIVVSIHNDTSFPMTIDSLDLALTSGSGDSVVIPQNAVHAEWLFHRGVHNDDVPDCTRKTFAGLPSDFKTVRQDTAKYGLAIDYHYPMDIPNAATELRMHLRMQLRIHGDIVKIDRSYTLTKQYKSYTRFLRDG